MNQIINLGNYTFSILEIISILLTICLITIFVRLLAASKENNKLNDENYYLEFELNQLKAELENDRRHHNEKIEILTKAKDELSIQFKSIAQDIFEEKSQQFGKQSKEKISDLLAPLNKEIIDFRNNINQVQLNQSKEQASLKQEIHHLRNLNLQMGEETANLTRALRSDKKLQGDWGELILEKALEMSGLRKGIEFETQTSFRNQTNDVMRPDAIIHLPDNKDIIVDSKVSLNNWQRAMASESPEQEVEFIKLLATDIKNHIKGLSSKNYSELTGLNSLDFVLLFMPIETAFTAVASYDQKIISYALKAKIIIATPTTLLATLKTIDNIWRSHQQEQNSKEIAKRAGMMYDKLRLFLEDMEKIGKQLNSCQNSYDSAINKLSQGRGNLISQSDQLKNLGVQIKKELPSAILTSAEIIHAND